MPQCCQARLLDIVAKEEYGQKQGCVKLLVPM